MSRGLSFAEGKKATDAWLSGKPAKDNYWPMPPDANIAPLIRALNTLPFLYTHACCGGHIRTKKAVRELLVGGISTRKLAGDDEFGAYSGAWFSFTVDGSSRGERFVRALRALIRRRRGSSLERLPGDDRTWGVQLTGARESAPAESLKEARALERSAERRIAEVLALVHRHGA